MSDETTPETAPVEATPETVAEATPEVVQPAAPVEKTAEQKRIDQLTAQVRSLGRELDTLKPKKEEPVKEPPKAAPTLAQFEFDQGAYDKAHAEWIDSLVEQKVSERLTKAEQKQAEQRQSQTFAEREAEYEKANPGYRDRVYNDDVPINQDMAAIIAKSPDGPAMADYLAQHPEEARLIYELPREDAAFELGTIRARLAKPEVKAAVVQISKAPPPPPKIEATDSSVRITPDSPESDTAWTAEEWAARRNKQLSRKKTG